MTVSWLTPINNSGMFFLSMNEKRHSAVMLEDVLTFTLSIPVVGMEGLVASVGGCSGRDVDKFEHIEGMTLCRPGWGKMEEGGVVETGLRKLSKRERRAVEAGKMACIKECVAHVAAKVESIEHRAGHLLIIAQTVRSFVRSSHWWMGKTFRPVSTDTSPCLSFLGSTQFAMTIPTTDS